MAFTGGTIWEVQTGGDDANNGGGFDTGVSGFATDGKATSATGNSPVFTSASYNFVAGDVGARIYIKSGTNWIPGFYTITSVASNAATIDATVGAAVLAGLTPSTVAGCATTASPTGATWGVDYSVQAASQFTSTTFASGTTTTLTDATNVIGKNWIGNIISITAGTSWTIQRVAVVSTAAAVATVDKTLGGAGLTLGTGRLGGALASPGKLGALTVQNVAFLKTGTYLITSATTNISGGCSSFVSYGTIIVGYSINRYFGNTDARPLIQASGISTFTMWQYGYPYNINFDGAGLSSGRGIIYAIAYNCKFSNFTNSALYGSSAILCEITGCATTVACSSGVFLFCVFHGNSFRVSDSSSLFCIAYANTATPFGTINIGCISYGNTGASTDGFYYSTSGPQMHVNCIAEANGRYGFVGSSGGPYGIQSFLNCAAYNNSGGNTAAISPYMLAGFTTLSGSAFVNAAAQDFRLNNTAGAGALLRQTGYPTGQWPSCNASMLSYMDIGAIQAMLLAMGFGGLLSMMGVGS